MRKTKKRLAVCLAGVMAASLMGCGGPSGTEGINEQGADGAEGMGNGDAVMGRYMESSQSLDIGEVTDLLMLGDGRLELLENGSEGRYISTDGGKTWEADILPGWESLAMNFVVSDLKGAPDGTVALLCQDYQSVIQNLGLDDEEENPETTEEGTGESSETSGEEDDKESPDTSTETEGEKSSETSGAEDGKESPEISEKEDGKVTSADTEDVEIALCLISPEGEMRQFPMFVWKTGSLCGLCFSEDGERLFLSTGEGKIYEIDQETGESRFLIQIDIIPDVFCVWEHYLAAKGEAEGVFLYDLDTQEEIEDDVLSDFVAQNYQQNNGIVNSTYTIFPAEDGGIYLAGTKGLHRHVTGGAVMEQVINGGLCSLSDPSKSLAVVARTADDGFLAAFSGGRISAFTYDPNMPSTPSQTLSAYSLTENDILRQAITRYQEANPDVYVEYRVGLSEEGGATREDAVKKLNTEIMAGKGPDFLVLDGLPVDSYKEKGVLLDISPYLLELETQEKLLSNIKESFTEDGTISMIPAAFTVQMYYTNQKNMTNVSDLSTLADLFERLRDEHPGEELMELYSKDMLFDALLPVSAPNWVTNDGADLDRIAEDLTQMKRIYDACMEGLSSEVLMKYKGYTERGINSSDKVSAYNDLGGGAVQIAGDNVLVSMGTLTNGYNYGLLQSVKRQKGGVGSQMAQIPGSAADAFTPVTLMGINATSQKSDLAGDFMQSILSKDMQEMIYPIGFPVNEEGLALYMESLGGRVPESVRKPGEIYGGYGFSTEEDGEIKVIVLDMYVPTEEETAEICDTLKVVHIPYLENAALENAVRETAEVYLDGLCSLEEAMNGIREASTIIMAE